MKILDIRTASIKNKRINNYLQNIQLQFESNYFKNITILSKKLISVIGLNRNKCHWLPLGSEYMSLKDKTFEEINLLYVGTFFNRNIDETIEGLNIFIKKNKLQINYDIIGFGTIKEENLLTNKIKEYKLEKIVKLHGWKNHQELQYYYDKCNVGVSYVPMTVYYNFQPPTKTFEYILSGMFCIATNTYENSILINNTNGVLCDNNPESFSKALETVFTKRNMLKADKIRSSLSEYTWENIINNNLKKYLLNILNSI